MQHNKNLIPEKVYVRHKGRKWPTVILEFTNPDPSKKWRIQKSFTVNGSIELAEEAAEIIRNEINRATFKIEKWLKNYCYDLITLGTFEEYWLKFRENEVNNKQISLDTLRADRDSFKVFKIVIPLDTPLNQVDKAMIKNFVDYILENNYSPNSTNHYLAHLSSAFSWAANEKNTSRTIRL